MLSNLFKRKKVEEYSTHLGEDAKHLQKEKVTYEKAVEEIQIWLMKNTLDNSNDIITSDYKQQVLSLAMSRSIKHIHKAKNLIKRAIAEENIIVNNYNSNQLAEKVFADIWGLSILEEYALDNITDEIRVNTYNKIHIVQNGVSKRLPITLKDDEEVQIIIKRMIVEDIGVSIDLSNPRIESILKDGSRLTAICPPISKNWSFILRQHGAFKPTLENYIKKETLNNKVWEALSILTRGRASLLISGNVGAGKTTLMRKLAGELNKQLRIIVIGKDLEMLLSELYPDKDIVELEEQEHLEISMKELFVTSLRQSPDVIIIEEFRGSGEAIEAVRACTRGLDGSMATAHFNSAFEAVEGTALFMLEEGLTLPINIAKLRVARAFNIVIQMYGDAITGKKKIVGVTEIGANENGEIYYNELIKWLPDIKDDYFGTGKWVFINKPTSKLTTKLLKNIKKEELEGMGWI